MKQEQQKQELAVCVAKLKRAVVFAESLLSGPVRSETIHTLWQLSGEAHSHINGLKSVSAGNETPKVG